ncbi:MAG: tRNA 2-selenouridine(34) synthase MnmH [Gammaproteobacteria bacterium]|nr:tRNA 2-selenouridine(34) synthase MnmH [Gammaproteobacteria bacterium]
MSRADATDFTQLFLTDTPLMDTRAPVEFEKGAFPHTLNLPLMTDDEREQVGTCYKQQGQEAAIELGHQLVQGDVKQQRLEQWLAFAREHPNGYLYCFRGGLRSQIVQQWMREAGCDYPRITGGYKALRRFLIDSQEQIIHDSQFCIVAGHTGCAKTDLLNTLDNSIDLEEIANHRGSSFGKRPAGQPTPIDFENRLAIAFLRQHHARPNQRILLEDESKLIGRCALPLQLRERMATAPIVRVTASLEQRVEHSFRNYILYKLQEWQQAVGVEAGFAAFSADLTDSLLRTKKRLGGALYQEIDAVLQQALLEHQQGDDSLHRAWIEMMLSQYYDPMYEYQLANFHGTPEFIGDANQVREYLIASAEVKSASAPSQV